MQCNLNRFYSDKAVDSHVDLNWTQMAMFPENDLVI